MAAITISSRFVDFEFGMSRSTLSKLTLVFVMIGLVIPKGVFGTCCCALSGVGGTEASCCSRKSQELQRTLACCCCRDRDQTQSSDEIDEISRDCRCERFFDNRVEATPAEYRQIRKLLDVAIQMDEVAERRMHIDDVAPSFRPSVWIHGPPINLLNCVWRL